jgi:hypothetical protein
MVTSHIIVGALAIKPKKFRQPLAAVVVSITIVGADGPTTCRIV